MVHTINRQSELNSKAAESKNQIDIDIAVSNAIDKAESIMGSNENDVFNAVSSTLEFIGVSNSEAQTEYYIKRIKEIRNITKPKPDDYFQYQAFIMLSSEGLSGLNEDSSFDPKMDYCTLWEAEVGGVIYDRS